MEGGRARSAVQVPGQRRILKRRNSLAHQRTVFGAWENRSKGVHRAFTERVRLGWGRAGDESALATKPGA